MNAYGLQAVTVQYPSCNRICQISNSLCYFLEQACFLSWRAFLKAFQAQKEENWWVHFFYKAINYSLSSLHSRNIQLARLKKNCCIMQVSTSSKSNHSWSSDVCNGCESVAYIKYVIQYRESSLCFCLFLLVGGVLRPRPHEAWRDVGEGCRPDHGLLQDLCQWQVCVDDKGKVFVKLETFYHMIVLNPLPTAWALLNVCNELLNFSRTQINFSKKWGTLCLVNQLFKIYFKVFPTVSITA